MFMHEWTVLGLHLFVRGVILGTKKGPEGPSFRGQVLLSGPACR